MSGFLMKVKRFIAEHNLFRPSSKVLIGFSGGADSTALCYCLHTIKDELGIELEAAHVNYNLRGEESQNDCLYVEDFCQKIGLHLTVKEAIIDRKANLEAYLRAIRYRFFYETVEIRNLDYIALGHNKNDVAETVLMNLFRGSGLTGLKGITSLSGFVRRPLLCCSRAEVEEYLLGEGIDDWREDRTNYENIYTRNRIRNELIPYIQEQINPKVIETIYHNASIINRIDIFLSKEAKRLIGKMKVIKSRYSIEINLPSLMQFDEAVVYYVLITLIREITSRDYYLTGNSFQAIIDLYSAEGSKEIIITSGLIARKEYDKLTFIAPKESSFNISKKSYEDNYKVRIEPDIIEKFLQIGDVEISYRICDYTTIKNPDYDKAVAIFDYRKIVLPIYVGYRVPGMLFSPLGMKGTKKVKKYFIDEKISKFERDRIPIISDSEKVLWIVGHRLDSRAKVNQDTTQALVLKVIKDNRKIRKDKRARYNVT